MDGCIRVRGLTKVYERGAGVAPAVDGIDLDVAPGEIVALLGPNGAGKTTTIDMILGFVAPTSGQVTVFGLTPRATVAAGRVSAVLQTGGLLRDLTVGETAELIASTYPSPPPTGAVLAQAGLDGLSGRKVRACSGGEQQRLRFALALLADPDLLLLDEPTAGMDVEGRRIFWAAMAAEATRGRTIVFATHYLQEAEDFAPRTVLLAGGRIVADGPTDEVRRHAAGRTVRARVTPDRIGAVVDRLAARPDVHTATADADRLVIETANSDAVAALLLSELGGRDLEIEAASLETAFLRLTGTGTGTGAGTSADAGRTEPDQIRGLS
ncbi:MAG: ABC transporter ATP-binding protein [Acidimicrobiales bacterium]